MELEWNPTSWKRWILVELQKAAYSSFPFYRQRAVVVQKHGMWSCTVTPYRSGTTTIRPEVTYHRTKAEAMAVAVAHVRLS